MASKFSPERPAVLDNPHSDRVRKVAGLAGRSARSRTRLMLVEGPQAVREVVSFRGSHLRDVYVTRTASAMHPDIVEAAHQATRWVHEVTDDVAQAMSPDAQGILAVAELSAIDTNNRVTIPEGATIAVFAQGRDPGNVGTIIRTADAMGASAVITVSGTVDVRNPKVVRSSAGSVFHLPIVSVSSFDEAVVQCRAWGATLLGTTGGSGTIALDTLISDPHSVLRATHAWVFGNEAKGLQPEQLQACDVLVNIPMTGPTESLNVASAAAMCLYASQLRRSTRSARGRSDNTGAPIS
ncbi:RNA methyltransferase [Schaalia sp. ZJ1691]|uniref:TrmH family RNA methyltransferase n=1 Tax=Schaalia sp. ZJ1691 TaxID=2709404 RepID=UPI0013E9F788|nr:RNA methyltransferase [Schaalia sp. ZJ1691]